MLLHGPAHSDQNSLAQPSVSSDTSLRCFYTIVFHLKNWEMMQQFAQEALTTHVPLTKAAII